MYVLLHGSPPKDPWLTARSMRPKPYTNLNDADVSFCHAARIEKQGEFRVSNHEPGIAPTPLPHPQPAGRAFWPQGWWRLMELRIGVIPLPVYLITIGVLAYF